MTKDPLEVPLEDETLVEEIGLLTELMLAATDHHGPLDPAEVDIALGLPDREP